MYKGHNSAKHIYDLCRKFIVEEALDINLLVDFGARHGESYEFLKEFCKLDYVFVEPAPRAAFEIKKIIEKWNDSVIIEPEPHLIQAILGSEPGTIDMHIFENDNDQSANIFTDRGGQYGKTTLVSVPVVSYDIFDKLFPGRVIDFAKINIEGAEYQMIEDGFFKRINSFVMELHNKHVKDRTWENAKELLQHDFDITTYGDLDYKYCFMSGRKCV